MRQLAMNVDIYKKSHNRENAETGKHEYSPL